MSAKEVKEALVSVLTEKDIRKVKLGVTSKKIFSANYLFVKVLETTHTLEDFTPSGDTFCTEDFEIIHGVDHNMSDKAFNIPQKGSKVIIFTDQKKGPEGTVYIKNISSYQEKLVAAVKEYNARYSGEYDAGSSLSDDEELVE